MDINLAEKRIPRLQEMTLMVECLKFINQFSQIPFMNASLLICAKSRYCILPNKGPPPKKRLPLSFYYYHFQRIKKKNLRSLGK